MNVQQYIDQMKQVQEKIINYIENEDDIEQNFQILLEKIQDLNIQKDANELVAFLHLLMKITNNHYRSNNFFSKIEKILIFLKNDIQKQLSPKKIFAIFSHNKRILLFFIKKEPIITIDENILDIFQNNCYLEKLYKLYFYPEIKPLLKSSKPSEIEEKISNEYEMFPDKFDRYREIGENENHLCKLIRQDSIDEFISYISQNEINISLPLAASIFETNTYLYPKGYVSLLQYSAFYGSVSIFKYLYLNTGDFPENLWLFAIHGNNPELLSYLEDLKKPISKQMIEKMLIESIKCHHNEMFDYIRRNFDVQLTEKMYIKSLKYQNYICFPNNVFENIYFYNFCKYDYFTLVKLLIESSKIDINFKIIQKLKCF